MNRLCWDVTERLLAFRQRTGYQTLPEKSEGGGQCQVRSCPPPGPLSLSRLGPVLFILTTAAAAACLSRLASRPPTHSTMSLATDARPLAVSSSVSAPVPSALWAPASTSEATTGEGGQLLPAGEGRSWEGLQLFSSWTSSTSLWGLSTTAIATYSSAIVVALLWIALAGVMAYRFKAWREGRQAGTEETQSLLSPLAASSPPQDIKRNTKGSDGATGVLGVGVAAPIGMWVVALLTLGSVTSSIALTFFNQYLLSARFPYPASYTMVSLAGTSLCTASLIYGAGIGERIERLPVCPWVLWSRMLVLAALSTINLWSGNAAFLYIDAGFITMLKSVGAVSVYVLLVLAGKEVSEFSWVGVWLVIAAMLSQAAFYVGSQVLMQEGGHEIEPLAMLLAVSVPSTFLVAIVALATEWLTEDFNWMDLPWYLAVGVVVLGMCQSLITLAFLRYVDAMAVVVVSYLRNILVVLIAVVFTHEAMNGTEAMGYVLLLLGLGTWRTLKDYDYIFDKDVDPLFGPHDAATLKRHQRAGEEGNAIRLSAPVIDEEGKHEPAPTRSIAL